LRREGGGDVKRRGTKHAKGFFLISNLKEGERRWGRKRKKEEGGACSFQ